jgi:ABC-type Mn2+/Zn2+ transport system permease subunit
VIGWIIAASASLIGLVASYQLDLPTGAAIVCACGLLLVLVNLFVALRPGAT